MKQELRRIPLEDKFMVKKVNDILYGYLQSISYIDKNKTRFVYKSEINFCQLESYFKGEFKRLKLKRDLDFLINAGFVKEDKIIDLYGKEVDAYILPFNQDSLYKLIPVETLKFLVNTLSTNTIKIYTYLLNRYTGFGSEYHFTMKELIKVLGMKSVTHQRDYEMVDNILTCLVNNDLIRIAEYTELINNKPVPRKRLLQVNLDYKKRN